MYISSWVGTASVLDIGYFTLSQHFPTPCPYNPNNPLNYHLPLSQLSHLDRSKLKKRGKNNKEFKNNKLNESLTCNCQNKQKMKSEQQEIKEGSENKSMGSENLVHDGVWDMLAPILGNPNNPDNPDDPDDPDNLDNPLLITL